MGVIFKCGVGPRFKTSMEGEIQHNQRGPLEGGVLEFGGKALGEDVWVGFKPNAVGAGLR